MTWFPIRKTSTIVHVEYDHATATLFAENICVRPEDPFDISVDLNKNLRTRHKSVGTYMDARNLAAGRLRTLHSIQIDEEHVLDRLCSHLEHFGKVPEKWRLLVNLEGMSWFTIRPQLRGNRSLVLNVLSANVPFETDARH